MTRQAPTPASIRFPVAPRDVPAEKAARRLHLTVTEFEHKKCALFDRGFPRPDPTTGMYDLVAIDAWMDRRHNLTRSRGLTESSGLRNPEEVIGERSRRLLDG